MPASISLDLGRVPSVLAALANPVLVVRAAKAAAQSYNDDVHDWIDAGHGFAVGHHVENRSEGSLQDQTNWRPISDGGEAYSNASYARFVEDGTGLPAGHRQWVINPIAPGKALKIPVNTGGGFIFRRSAVHRGSQPKPFFFADRDNRQDHMVEAARLVLAGVVQARRSG